VLWAPGMSESPRSWGDRLAGAGGAGCVSGVGAAIAFGILLLVVLVCLLGIGGMNCRLQGCEGHQVGGWL
jgi:hypothetical protein